MTAAETVEYAQPAPGKTGAAFLHVVPPIPTTDHNSWGDINPYDYFGFPDQFNAREVRDIFQTEVRTHDSDGTPLSVYFGPTRVQLLADLAIDRYDPTHADAIRFIANAVTQEYMGKF